MCVKGGYSNISMEITGRRLLRILRKDTVAPKSSMITLELRKVDGLERTSVYGTSMIW